MESLGYWTLERQRDMLVLRPAPGPSSLAGGREQEPRNNSGWVSKRT
jgi:hypothetical protein